MLAGKKEKESKDVFKGKMMKKKMPKEMFDEAENDY